MIKALRGLTRGEHRARWRTIDRYLAAAAVTAVAVGVVLFAGHTIRPSSAVPTGPGPAGALPAATGFKIEIRPVLTETQAAPGSCPQPVQQPATATDVRACSADATFLFSLGAAAVTGEQFEGITVQPDASTGFDVAFRLTPAGAIAFHALTGRLATQQSPRNQLAIYAQGLVQSSPFVSAPITGGNGLIAGFTSETDAHRFVARVTP
jgi:preprotein translocase subunit SecD